MTVSQKLAKAKVSGTCFSCDHPQEKHLPLGEGGCQVHKCPCDGYQASTKVEQASFNQLEQAKSNNNNTHKDPSKADKAKVGSNSDINNKKTVAEQPPLTAIDFDKLPDTLKNSITKLEATIDRSYADSKTMEEYIVDIARELDERGLCKRDQISRWLRILLSDKIKAGKVTERWIYKCLPDDYKRRWSKSEVSSLSGSKKPMDSETKSIGIILRNDGQQQMTSASNDATPTKQNVNDDVPIRTDPNTTTNISSESSSTAENSIGDVGGGGVGEDGCKIMDTTGSEVLPSSKDATTIKNSAAKSQHQPQQQGQSNRICLIDRNELLLQLLSDEISDVKDIWLCGRIESGTRKLLDMVLERDQQPQVVVVQ